MNTFTMDYVRLNMSLETTTVLPGLQGDEWTNTTWDNGTWSNGSVGNGSASSNSSSNVRMETEQCRLFRFMLYAVICGLLCLLGFVGNTLSFLVLQKDKSAPVASFLLQVMAVADNLFLVLWFIHYSMRDVFRYFSIDAHKNPVWIYVRVYTFPVLFMMQMETIWLTVIVAMNRFMAVCLPYRAPSLCTIHNVYKEVVVVTIFSILYNIPRFLELSVESDENTISWYRTSVGSDQIFKTLYIDAMYYLFTFVLPLLVLGFVNTRVIIAYRATQQRKRRMTSRRAENENNITLVMIMVVAIFMLCQAPARLVQLIWSYSFSHCEEYQYYLIHISNSLEVLNSSINFLIYFSFRKRFRDILGEYYCTNGPLKLKQECRKSLTTEALALSEYQPTAATGSVKKGTSIRSHESSPNINPQQTNEDIISEDKTTQVTSVINGRIEGSENIDSDQKLLNNDEQRTPLVEPIQQESAVEQNGRAVSKSRSFEQQPLQTELIEYELSSENPVSRASSPDDGVLHDGQMLIATVEV